MKIKCSFNWFFFSFCEGITIFFHLRLRQWRRPKSRTREKERTMRRVIQLSQKTAVTGRTNRKQNSNWILIYVFSPTVCDPLSSKYAKCAKYVLLWPNIYPSRGRAVGSFNLLLVEWCNTLANLVAFLENLRTHFNLILNASGYNLFSQIVNFCGPSFNEIYCMIIKFHDIVVWCSCETQLRQYWYNWIQTYCPWPPISWWPIKTTTKMLSTENLTKKLRWKNIMWHEGLWWRS